MSATFENLQILRSAEVIADSVWNQVMQWDDFAKDVVGKQIAKSADSIGANIAESFGRFNFGEKLQFLYYSRGSLFETKYWLNRVKERSLMNIDEVQKYSNELTTLARQLNTFTKGLRSVRAEQANHKFTVRESPAEYSTLIEFPEILFSDEDLNFLNG
ncbi:MAG: 30S ribosomal protein S23 [Chloroflexi bacterium OLB14]|nr:MAG: 30S ribosomal protein S23 [Chloroflexi bacterium OLB14]